jgi:hypothetical protein
MAGAQARGYRLAEAGQLTGGIDYAAVGQAVTRFGKRLKQDRELRRQLAEVENHMSNVDSAEI